MKLYSTDGPVAVTDPDTGDLITSDEDDALELASVDLFNTLHAQHVAGRQMFEDEVERDTRLVREDLERRRDPATLLAAIERREEERNANLTAGLTAEQILDAEEARKIVKAAQAAEREAEREAERAELEAAAELLAERQRIAAANAELDRQEQERQEAEDAAAREASVAAATEAADAEAEAIDNPPADGVADVEVVDLGKLNRAELDTLAREVGVPDPEALPNKDAVREAITAHAPVAEVTPAE